MYNLKKPLARYFRGARYFQSFDVTFRGSSLLELYGNTTESALTSAILEIYQNFRCTLDPVVQGLSPGMVRVRVLCSWVKYFTFTVPGSPLSYMLVDIIIFKLILAN